MTHYRKIRHARRMSKRSQSKVSPPAPIWLWLLIGILIGILSATLLYFLLLAGKGNPQKVRPSLDLSDTPLIENKPLPKPKAVTQKEVKAQRFEFYHLLPGMEVPIPDIDHTGVPGTLSQSPKPNIDATPKGFEKALDATSQKLKAIQTTKSSPLNPLLQAQKATPKSKFIPTPLALAHPKSRPSKTIPHTDKKIAAAHYLIQVSAFRQINQAEKLKAQLAVQGFSPRIQKVLAQDGTWFRVILGPFASETMALKQKKYLEKYKIHGILFLQR